MSSPAPIVVLFADITGSTRLYEAHGDEVARTAIAECIDILDHVVRRHEGQVLKTIGDEIMCVFTSPAKAILAANEMQLAVREAGEQDRFATGPLRIKIGAHFAPGIVQQTDVFGEASIIAQQIIGESKADQILVSGETFDALPPALRVGSRPIDTIDAEGREAPVRVIEMIWEVSDLTQVGDTTGASTEVLADSSLILRYENETIELGSDRSRLTIGRTEVNDLMVPTNLASRTHAVIEYRRGRFILTDMSTNGTVVVDEQGMPSHLRGESIQLTGEGKFCLGGTPEINPEGLIEFECS